MDYLAKGVVFWLSVYLYAGQILVDSLSQVPLSRVSAGKSPDDNVPEPVTTAISKGVECGGQIFANQGQIISPGYPVQNYSSNSNCTWSITADEGKLLLMKFEYIDIEVGPPDCPFDGVIVVDNAGMAPVVFTPGPNPFGASWTGPSPIVIGKYCGRDKFPAFTSVTNSVQLGFYSDLDMQMGGFLFTWKTLDVRSSALHSCDFENGLCSGWENVNTREDVFDWTVTKGSTPTKKTGPGFDHTKGDEDGSYAFIESSKPRQENDTALLASPQITFRDDDTSYCLEFWYHMHGKTMGSLIVGFAIGDRRLIEWRMSGDQGDEWKHTLVSIKKVEEPMKVIFAGVIGGSYTADIAIDDIKVYEKPCSEVNWKDRVEMDEEFFLYNMPCENEEDYPCENSTTCIPDAKMCDGTADCPGKDDESGHLCISVAATTSFPQPPIFTTEMDETTMEDEYYTTVNAESTASNDDTTTQYIEEATTVDELLFTTVGVATTISDVAVATTDDLTATEAVTVAIDVSTTDVYIPTEVAATNASTEAADEFETTESSDADATTTQESEVTTQETVQMPEETTADSIGFTTKSSRSDSKLATTSGDERVVKNNLLMTTSETSPERATTRHNGVNNLVLATKPSLSADNSPTSTVNYKTTSVAKASSTKSTPHAVRSTARPTSRTPNTPGKKSDAVATSRIPDTTQIRITGNIQAPTAAEKQKGSAQSTTPVSICVLLFSGLLSLLLIQA